MDSQLDSVVTTGISKLNLKRDGDEDVVDPVYPLNGDEDNLLPLHPLQIDEILDIIMDNCGLETLKTARLVCKLWNLEAIPKLYKKYYFTVPESLYNKTEDDKMSRVVHIKRFLQNHQITLPKIQMRSPRDVYVFKSFGDTDGENNPVLGPSGTELVYRIQHSIWPLQTLLEHLPNLQIIKNQPQKLDTMDPDFCLELLKTCAQFQPRVITLSHFNMKTRFSDGSEYLDKIKAYSTVDNVRFNHLAFSIVPHPNYSGSPHLPQPEILSPILERNKNNLTSLWVSGLEMYLKKPKIPQLPRLKKFHMRVFAPSLYNQVRPKYEFPPDFQLSTNFPTMNEMSILVNRNITTPEVDRVCPQFWSFYFAAHKSVPSVKSLSYCDYACDFSLNPLLLCFPRLEQLDIQQPGDFAVVAESIFKFGKKLKKLNVEIKLESLTCNISSFDAIFTGFSQFTVEQIKNGPKYWDIKEMLVEGMTLDDLRVQPSLCDLQYLELLTIKIKGDVRKHLPRKIFTVAGKFAFGLLPNLKVEISIGGKEQSNEQNIVGALKEVSEWSNVTIVYAEK